MMQMQMQMLTAVKEYVDPPLYGGGGELVDINNRKLMIKYELDIIKTFDFGVPFGVPGCENLALCAGLC